MAKGYRQPLDDQINEAREHRVACVLNPYVHVDLRIGTTDFPRCTADIFEKDTLTVSSLDTGHEMHVYLPGEWRECTVYNDQHDWLFTFVSGTPVRPIIPLDELRRQANATEVA